MKDTTREIEEIVYKEIAKLNLEFENGERPHRPYRIAKALTKLVERKEIEARIDEIIETATKKEDAVFKRIESLKEKIAPVFSEATEDTEDREMLE